MPRHPRMPLNPASGHGINFPGYKKVIRFAKFGCTNRPFFHIVVALSRLSQKQACIEQVGSYDPCPNSRNERLVGYNAERIQHWVGKGAHISKPVRELLGLAGFLPIHPRTYIESWRKRRQLFNSENQESNEDKEKKDVSV